MPGRGGFLEPCDLFTLLDNFNHELSAVGAGPTEGARNTAISREFRGFIHRSEFMD